MNQQAIYAVSNLLRTQRHSIGIGPLPLFAEAVRARDERYARPLRNFTIVETISHHHLRPSEAVGDPLIYRPLRDVPKILGAAIRIEPPIQPEHASMDFAVVTAAIAQENEAIPSRSQVRKHLGNTRKQSSLPIFRTLIHGFADDTRSMTPNLLGKIGGE